MIRTLSIKGLRGVEEATVAGLAPVTVLLGPNGSGKSTVLEGLGVACAGLNAAEAFRALARREWLGVHALKFWIPEGAEASVDAEHETPRGVTRSATHIRIVPEQETAVRFMVQFSSGRAVGTPTGITVDDDGNTSDSKQRVERPFEFATPFVERAAGAARRLASTRYSSALRDALTAIKLSPEYDELVSNLQILRPRLTSIESLAVGERDEPFMIEKDPRSVFPLAYAGDGFRRALLLASAFAKARGGLVAIDEPESFAHPSLFEAVCKLIAKASQAGTQVVMATHSLEFVSSLLREFSGALDKTAVIGLSMENRRIDSVLIPGPDAERRVLELGHDLRL